jgi:ectoine hydroxylase-related dioxygenase (phytanoyl-CoA dioxygenase family)
MRAGRHVRAIRCDGWPTPHSRRVKAFVSFWDTTAEGGATAVVPYSHRTPAGPKDTLQRKFTGGGFVHAERPPDGQGVPLANMPNMLALALPAGVSFIIDQAVWHCALPNTSSQPRRNVIVGYGVDRARDRVAVTSALVAAIDENVAAGTMQPTQRDAFL